MKKLATQTGLDELNLSDGLVAYDTETTGLYPYGDPKRLGFFPARPFAFSFSDSRGNVAYVRFYVDPFTREVIYDVRVLRKIKRILEDKRIKKIAHNFGFDLRMCEYAGINVQNSFEDTQILAHSSTGGQFLTYALKPFMKQTVGFPDDDEEDLLKSVRTNRRKGKKLGWKIATKETHGKKHMKADFWLANPILCQKYAIRDSERTMIGYLGLEHKLQDQNIRSVYEREKQLFWVVKNMEDTGVKISPRKIRELERYYNRVLKTQRKIIDLEGSKTLNPRSGPQLQKVFFQDKKYSPLRYTEKRGNPSTDGDTLEYLVNRYNDKLARAVIEYKSASTMLSTFIDAYKRLMTFNGSEYVLHPNFLQVGTVTGRFASSDPNLQQVASDSSGRKKSQTVMRIRELFIPREGKMWYLPDYSQMEVWVFSLLSEEPSLMAPLLRGEDFHASVAKQVWGHLKDFKQRPEFYRKKAKLLMFCRLYGGGASQVAKQIGCSVPEAYEFIDDYNAKIPGVERYMNRISTRIHREGKITNPFGRTYHLPHKAAYKGVNYMVQGTCADLMKRAMIRLHDRFKKSGKDIKILLTIHDELSIESSIENHSNALMRNIIKDMQKDSKVIGCPVPLPITMKTTKTRWSDCQEQKFLFNEWKDKYT